MQFEHGSRKAVAPVIATLLMIAVAVAMSVIIFMWSQGFLSQTSGATGGQQGSQNQAAQSSIAIELATFNTGTGTGGTPCSTTVATSPEVTLVVRNVGAVAVTLGSLTITGITSNSGFKGSITVSSVSSTAVPIVAVTSQSDPGTAWGYFVTLSPTLSKGGSATIRVCNVGTAALPTTQILSGDVINIKQTTNVGTFAQSQFTVP